MRYFALATDYDGTLATHGVVRDSTLRALERFVASGRKLVLVTGRQLDDRRASLCAPRPVRTRRGRERRRLCTRPSTRGSPSCSTSPRRAAFVEAARARGASARRGRAGHRGDARALRERRARDDPRDGARAARRVQQGRGDGPSVGNEQARPGLAAALEDMRLSPHERGRRRAMPRTITRSFRSASAP